MSLSNYPAALDTTSNLPDNHTNSSITQNEHATHHNTLADAVLAIETALGINPQGGAADVATRLNNVVVNNPSADQVILPLSDHVGLIIKAGGNAFISDLQEWRLNNGTTVAFVDKLGNISSQGFFVNGSPLSSTNLADSGLLARLASPSFTGTPTAPTPAPGDSTQKIATTQFVTAASAPQSASGVLASRPAASSKAGAFYYASDQAVLYFSDGSTWIRQGLPVGSTTMLFGIASTVPTGWVRYDGTTLPSSTGIYADLYAHLGNNLTKPDTISRTLLDYGTNAVISAIGLNDGTSAANRAATRHRHAPHLHTGGGNGGSNGVFPNGSTSVMNGGTQSTGTADGGSGVSTDPLDGPAWISGLLIAKL